MTNQSRCSAWGCWQTHEETVDVHAAAVCTWATVCSCVCHFDADARADLQGDRAEPVRQLTPGSGAPAPSTSSSIQWFSGPKTLMECSSTLRVPPCESRTVCKNRCCSELSPTSSRRINFAEHYTIRTACRRAMQPTAACSAPHWRHDIRAGESSSAEHRWRTDMASPAGSAGAARGWSHPGRDSSLAATGCSRQG